MNAATRVPFAPRVSPAVRRAASRTAAAPGLAPASVHDVLQSPGRPLDADARSFMEPRLGHLLGANALTPGAHVPAALSIDKPGDAHENEADRIAEGVLGGPASGLHYDLSRIRIHTDPRAAESARDVNALAFTVGDHIVFDEGMYSPHSSSGMRLLAHELAHTAQRVPGLSRQPRLPETHDPQPKFSAPGVCLGSAACKDIKLPSSLLQEAETPADKQKREKRTKDCAAPESPACRADGHAARAAETEKLLRSFDPARMANVKGIFVDRDMEADFSALTTTCGTFTPALAPDGQCIVVPQEMEDDAAKFNSPTGPQIIDGMERGLWRERKLEILVHESGHADFRTSFGPDFRKHFSDKLPNFLGKERATCRPDENSRRDVFSSLNELAAMMQEYPLRIQRARTNVNLNTPEARKAEMESWRDHRLRGTSQSITNSLRVVRCLCGCQDADDMIRETIESATRTWNVNEKNDLHREMRDPTWKDLDLRWPFIAPGTATVARPQPEDVYAENKKQLLDELNRNMPAALPGMIDGLDAATRFKLSTDAEIAEAVAKLPANTRNMIRRHLVSGPNVSAFDDPRDRVRMEDRSMYDDLRTFLRETTGQIRQLVGRGSSDVPWATAANANVQSLLAQLSGLLADLDAELLIIRFDQSTTGGQTGHYEHLGDVIHIRPFSDAIGRTQAAINLVHEYTHTLQDRKAESVAAVKTAPVTHERPDELEQEISARREQVYFTGFLMALGISLAKDPNETAGQETTNRVFIADFEKMRTGTPRERRESAQAVSSRIETNANYIAQLKANTPTRRYVIQVNPQRPERHAQLFAAEGSGPTDLGAIPSDATSVWKLTNHLKTAVQASSVFKDLFAGPGKTRFGFIEFTVLYAGQRVAQFDLDAPTP